MYRYNQASRQLIQIPHLRLGRTQWPSQKPRSPIHSFYRLQGLLALQNACGPDQLKLRQLDETIDTFKRIALSHKP